MYADHDEKKLLDLWRVGDQRAAQELFDRYVNRLVALARQHISQRLAARIDPEDVVQSVFRTFFAHGKAGQFCVEKQGDLCKLLMSITVHKTLRKVDFHKAAKRDAGHEVEQGADSRDRLRELVARGPTPEESVIFVDEVERFLDRLPPLDRQILAMRMENYSNEEICQKLGIYDRKIRRVFEYLRERAKQEGFCA